MLKLFNRNYIVPSKINPFINRLKHSLNLSKKKKGEIFYLPFSTSYFAEDAGNLSLNNFKMQKLKTSDTGQQQQKTDYVTNPLSLNFKLI